MTVTDKKNNFATREVLAVTALMNAFEELHALRGEWDASGYASTNPITDADLQGENDHLTATDLAAAFTSVAALDVVLNAGHATNLYKLVP